MDVSWIAVEAFAILMETFASVYFLNSRYSSKRVGIAPQLIVWVLLSAIGILAVLLEFPIGAYETAKFMLLFLFLLYFKHGLFLHKLLSLVILFTILTVTTLMGMGLASLMSNVQLGYTLLHQDTSRLVALIIIKSLQIVILYLLTKQNSKKNVPEINAQGKKLSTILCFAPVAVALLCNLLIYINIHDFDYGFNRTLTWLSIGLLLILVLIFVLYEMFRHEEASNIDLSIKLQRLESEKEYIVEINAIHTEIRTWRHEYSNNLLTLHKLIDNGQIEEGLAFIESVSRDVVRGKHTLHSGNLVLDAIVSSKLWIAKSNGIEISAQAVYPVNNHLDDSDLCSIVGNLLDNAIEACLRMSQNSDTRFVNFSLLVKGKNMAISIENSYEGTLNKLGNVYITDKDKRYHGIGLQYVDSIVNKYQGHVVRVHNNGVFKTHVMIPLYQERGG